MVATTVLLECLHASPHFKDRSHIVLKGACCRAICLKLCSHIVVWPALRASTYQCYSYIIIGSRGQEYKRHANWSNTCSAVHSQVPCATSEGKLPLKAYIQSHYHILCNCMFCLWPSMPLQQLHAAMQHHARYIMYVCWFLLLQQARDYSDVSSTH